MPDGRLARPPRQFERPRIDRGERLAGLDDLAPRGGIALGDRARAIKQLAAVLDHDIGIGTNHLQAPGVHGGENGVVILGCFAPGIDEPGAEDELGLFQRHQAQRLSPQGQNLLEERCFVGGTDAEHAAGRPLDQQGNGDIPGGDDRIIGSARKPESVELSFDDPARIGRIGDEHNLAAIGAKPAQGLGGFLEGFQPIVDDAPDVT